MQEWVAGAASLVEWLIAWLQVFWPAIVATAGVVAAVWVTLHVAQHKRDARAAAALFRIWQPRIDQAYRELGYPDESFSDVLLAAFRQLLAVPEIRGRPLLVPEGVGYAYADPELENLSASQKQLLRMGPENVLRVQQKLREIARHLGFSASQLPPATLYLAPPGD